VDIGDDLDPHGGDAINSYRYPDRVRYLLACLLVGLCVSCASGNTDTARSVEGQVWSPYCPGRLLVDCSTKQAHDLRAQIDQRIEDGETSDEVLDWVRSEYGDQAIARPEASGTGLLIWLVPAAIFLAGAGFVIRFVSRNVDPSTDNSKEEQRADP
jgi:cytochrome c-type biogenesis protein CcmH/NrfF